MATRMKHPFVPILLGSFRFSGPFTRDGIHANWTAAGDIATSIAASLCEPIPWVLYPVTEMKSEELGPDAEAFRQLITAKNRLWFDYWRVQNWAFLAGDRTSQPSSRDHLDKDKRWFPAERARFLPLIEAREKEIWAAAAKLAQP